MAQAIPWLVLGGGSVYAMTNGVPDFVKKLAKFDKDTKEKNNDQRNQSHQMEAPKTVVVHVPQQQQQNQRTWLFWSSTAVIGLAVYYYYIHNNGTRKVIGKVEETATETQDLVRECDENNEQRFEALDEKNQERADDLSAEIRGEARAHFDILSNQVTAVQNVLFQMVNTLSEGITGGRSTEDNEEFARANKSLIEYATNQQVRNDQLFSDEKYLQTRDYHVQECRTQIGTRKIERKYQQTVNQQSYKGTPGGPDAYGTAGGFGTDDGNPYAQTISVLPGGTSDNESDDEEEEDASLLDVTWVQNLGLSPTQRILVVSYVDPSYRFVKEKKFEIAVASVGTLALYKAFSWIADRIAAPRTTSEEVH